MTTIDPNAAPAAPATPDPAAAPPAPPPAPETSLADDMVAAMDVAIADADAAAEATPAPAPQDPPADAATVTDPAAPTADGKPTPTPEEVAAQEAAAAAKAKADAPPERDDAVEKEIVDLGIKNEKTAERFRAMSAEVKSIADVKQRLEKNGITDLSLLPDLIGKAQERVQAADEMIALVMQTGADAETYGRSLDYLSLANKAATGDRDAAERAFKIAEEEYTALAKMLGREVPGVHDPLAGHADLLAEIEAGDLTKKRALEIAQQRLADQQHRQVRDTTGAQQQAQQAAEQGADLIAQYDQRMLANDPTYLAKREALSAMVKFIKETLPPSRWLQATEQAYARIPAMPATPAAPAAPAAPARVPVGPVRGAGNSRPLDRAVYQTPEEAMEAGLAAAGG